MTRIGGGQELEEIYLRIYVHNLWQRQEGAEVIGGKKESIYNTFNTKDMFF